MSGEIVRLPKSLPFFLCRLALVIAVVILAYRPASAQLIGGITSPLLTGLPVLGRILDRNVPGLANPASPLVFPPYLQAEMKVRPVFFFVTEDTFKAPRQAISLNLRQDLGFDNQFVMVEFMARGQMGALSLRAHYETFLSTLKSDIGHFDWPQFRTGLDWDFLNTSALRFGVNADVDWERPVFSAVLPIVGTRSIKWDRPVTAGLQASFNPPAWGGLAFSLDSRVRWPVTAKSRVTDFEIGAGFRTAETVLGSAAVRAGWRYTAIDLRSSDDLQVDMKWFSVS